MPTLTANVESNRELSTSCVALIVTAGDDDVSPGGCVGAGDCLADAGCAAGLLGSMLWTMQSTLDGST